MGKDGEARREQHGPRGGPRCHHQTNRARPSGRGHSKWARTGAALYAAAWMTRHGAASARWRRARSAARRWMATNGNEWELLRGARFAEAFHVARVLAGGLRGGAGRRSNQDREGFPGDASNAGIRNSSECGELVYGLVPTPARSLPTNRPGFCTPRLVLDKSLRDFVKSGLAPRLVLDNSPGILHPRLVLDKTSLNFVRPV